MGLGLKQHIAVIHPPLPTVYNSQTQCTFANVPHKRRRFAFEILAQWKFVLEQQIPALTGPVSFVSERNGFRRLTGTCNDETKCETYRQHSHVEKALQCLVHTLELACVYITLAKFDTQLPIPDIT